MDAQRTPTLQDCLDTALAAHQAGDLVTARRYYANVLEREPCNPRALQLLGVVAFQEGNLASALDLLERADRLRPNDAGICRHRGSVLLTACRPDEAASAFRSALNLEPDDAETLFNLGLTERYLGHFDEAIALLRRAVGGMATVAMAHYELGLALHLVGRSPEAIQCYRDTIALEPTHATAFTNLGVLLQQCGDLKGAVAAYQQALAIQPDLGEALNNLGSALMEQGDLIQAVIILKRAVLHDPASANALTNLGTVLQRMGDPERAIGAFRAALDIDPLSSAAHANLADCLRELGRGDEVLASCRAVVATLPDHWAAHLLLGNELKRSDDLSGAIAAYRDALALARNEAEIHYQLGCALGMSAAVDEGIDQLQQALAIQPGNTSYARGLASALLRRGDGPGAIAACDRALAIDRFDQEALAYRALGLRLAGDHAAADHLTDLELWIYPTIPAVPAGYDDLDSFNHALAADLLALKSRRWQPAYQSIRGGTQTGNNIFTESVSTIQALHRAIDDSVRRYLDTLEPRADHPFLAGKPRHFAYRGWSVVLEDQGYHVSHIHPEGWLSGAYYVQVPNFEDTGDAHPGCIEFGLPWADLPFSVPPPSRCVAPAPGRLVLFPSYFWHGVRRFRSPGQRITVAFDLLPLQR